MLGASEVFQGREPRRCSFSVVMWSALMLVPIPQGWWLDRLYLGLTGPGTLGSLFWILSPSKITLVLGQPLVSRKFDSQNVKLTLVVLQHYAFSY